MKKPPLPSPSPVPRAYPGATIVCLGCGPSLTKDDVAKVRGRAVVIAINDAYRLAPWADVLYACDGKWWGWHPEALAFRGAKYALDRYAQRFAGVAVLKNTGTKGLERDPKGLRTGRNSGYQAINLAVLLGATKILLLGYDMQPRGGQDHWFGPHPYRTAPIPYDKILDVFPQVVEPLKAAGVTVINCTKGSALRCFPYLPIEEALA